MVRSDEYRHVPTGTLAILAQRLGKVFASPSTWYRLTHRFGWRRPRLRVHPAKPKVGLRTTQPNQAWHIDTTVIRLLDDSKAFLHAAIDNFSRRILAWRLADKFDPASTIFVLLEAGQGGAPSDEPPTVVTDAGAENVNRNVDELIQSGVLRRVIALTELRFSNSMIEAGRRTLKHQWLYLNSLDSLSTLRRLVAFYVDEHNARLPHSAFRGQTPDEMYYGRGDHVPRELEQARNAARKERLDLNRRAHCVVCPKGRPQTSVSNSEAVWLPRMFMTSYPMN
jgi:transposase InsO family protein